MTHNQTTRQNNTPNTPSLYIGFDLAKKSWKLAFGGGERIRHRTIDGRDFGALEKEIAKARTCFGLPDDCPVVSCYEAGPDAFWIHRQLLVRGIDNIVVDSSSIETNRRARRAKSDRIDAGKLLRMLMRYSGGERGLWSVVRIPTVEQEDARRLNRERARLIKERGSHSSRIRNLLTTVGAQHGSLGTGFAAELHTLTCADGQPLPPHLKREIEREYQRRQQAHEHLLEIDREQKRLLIDQDNTAIAKVRLMQTLRGVGPVSANTLVFELFNGRDFKNRRQLGGYLGIVPTPFNTGGSDREQGISKSGPRRLRALMVELAWLWLRHQPNSKLSIWFNQRCEGGSSRMRRIGIVAMARKLLIALWKFVERGVVPEGAVLKGMLAQAT